MIGVPPPKSIRKAAHGINAIAILVLWRNVEGVNLGFLDEDLLKLLGFCWSGEEDWPLNVEKVGRLEKGRWWRLGVWISGGIILFA